MITILILLNICHWIGDYTHLSTKEMLDAKRIGSPWHPIFDHACVHASLMGVTLGIYTHDNWSMHFALIFIMVLLIQLISHFLIDLLKGKLNTWFSAVSNPTNKSHWYIFGLDQLAHQIIIIIMAYLITNK